jgi:hypothetical protein
LASFSQLGAAGLAGDVSAAFTENVKPKRILKKRFFIYLIYID